MFRSIERCRTHKVDPMKRKTNFLSKILKVRTPRQFELKRNKLLQKKTHKNNNFL